MYFFLFKKRLFIYWLIFRQRGREREGEKHQCVVASHMPPTEDLACNSGMCPDWESNWWPFGSQARTQSTEPRQPGLKFVFYIHTKFNLELGFSINLFGSSCAHRGLIIHVGEEGTILMPLPSNMEYFLVSPHPL